MLRFRNWILENPIGWGLFAFAIAFVLLLAFNLATRAKHLWYAPLVVGAGVGIANIIALFGGIASVHPTKRDPDSK